MHVYKVRPGKDKRGVDLISNVVPFGPLWYGESNAVGNAIGYVEHYSRSHDAVIRVYDDAGDMMETHEYKAISKSGLDAVLFNVERFWRRSIEIRARGTIESAIVLISPCNKHHAVGQQRRCMVRARGEKLAGRRPAPARRIVQFCHRYVAEAVAAGHQHLPVRQ